VRSSCLSNVNVVMEYVVVLQGWRLMAPHFGSLVDSAIFPALTMKNKVWPVPGGVYLGV
jgi:hypothetical protein